MQVSGTPLSSPVRDRRPGSLGRRLVQATLLFCLLFTIATVSVRTWFAWNSNLDTMKAELGLIDQVFQGTLSKAVWEMDGEALQAQVESVSQAAPVGRVSLHIDRPGRAAEIIERHRADYRAGPLAPVVQRQLVVTPYPGAQEAVGTLVIAGDEDLLWHRLWKEVAIIIATQLIQSLALAGLIMAMFNTLVTVHVRHIARHLGQVAPDTLKYRLQLDRREEERDELALLEAGINNLQEKLAGHIERRDQAEAALEASRDQLADLVEERTAQLQSANARLETLARHDPLTGLANRRHFDELKELEFNRALRTQLPLSVLMCDIDYFKRYNDTHGHSMGDQCLRDVAEVMKETFNRSGELVARLGGEEFVVLLPGSGLTTAREAAERLRQALAARHLPHGASEVSSWVTLSIGIAELDPLTMDRFDALLQRADRALYQAKREGRDRSAG